MNGKTKTSVAFFLSMAFLFLLAGIWGTVRLSQRPGIKGVFEKRDGYLRVSQLAPGGKAVESGLKADDLVLEVDGNQLQSESDLKFLSEQKRIGESLGFTLQRGGEKLDLDVFLDRKYGSLFLLVNFLAGLFLWLVGVFVFLRRPDSRVVRIFLVSSLCFSLAILISFEGFPYGPKGLSFILPSLQIMAYALIPTLFFRFSMIFPREEDVLAPSKPVILSVFLPSLVLIVLMETFYWRSVSANSLSLFQAYKTLYLYFRIYLAAYVLLGLFVLYQTYRRLEFAEDKRKIRWIFWGISLGTFPFVFLHTLPEVLFGRTLIPEVVNYLFVSLIPLSFAFSILKYQAMDIDVVINRSVVYSLLTGFVLGIYLLVVGLFGQMLHRLTGYQGSLFPILATLVAAVLFTPAKSRIRALVDRTFYRVRYDYRKAIQKFNGEVNDAYAQKKLLSLLLERIDLLLAVKRALIFLKEDESKTFVAAKSLGFSEDEREEIEREKVSFLPELLETGEIRGSKGSTTFEEFPALPESEILKKFEIRLSFPLIEKRERLGLLLLGGKKSQVRYSAEDVELVSVMAQEVTRALQNIRMRERIVAEQLEKEKLEELNRLKTKFISNVSHDLRTPLTGIRFSVDNMLQGVCGEVSEESRKHLLMIQESTLHVSRTIDNLLTLSMSDSGKITLNKENLSLIHVVDEAYNIVRVLADKKRVNLVKEKLEDTFVYADRHCLLEMLLNLLDNAIKYTDSGGKISVSATRMKDEELVKISVTDDGVGIPPENLEKIFQRFHKVAPAQRFEKKSSGIGLDVVRNLVHLHGGEINVESPIAGKDRGTRFSFTLPRG